MLKSAICEMKFVLKNVPVFWEVLSAKTDEH